MPTHEDLERLGPFGEAHPLPRFQLSAHVVEATAVGAEGAHAKLELRVGQERIRAFAPSLYSRIEGRADLELIGAFQPDHWLGGRAVELLVEHVID